MARPPLRRADDRAPGAAHRPVPGGPTGDAVDAADAAAAEALVDGDRPLVPGSARAALRHPTFRRFFYGGFLSNIGTWMQNVVLGALAYDLTESSTFVGVLVFAQLGPMLLLSLVGGALVDTVDRRKLIGGIGAAQMVLSFGLAAVVVPDEPNLGLLVGLVVALGVCQALFAPAYGGLLPQLVPREDLPGAISLNAVQMNGARVVGPVIGAFVDSAFGAPAVFAANGVSYLFIIGTVLLVPLPAPKVREGAERGLRQVVAGLAQARDDLVIRRGLITLASFSLLSLAFIGQFPVAAERNLGIDERSTAYGGLYACFGIGAVAGALAVGTVLGRVPRARLVRLALPAYAVTLAAFSLVRAPGPAYPLIMLVGVAYMTFITSLSTVVQEQVGDESRGRVTALWFMAFGGVVPFGNLIAGPVIEATSVTTVLLFGAAWALLLTNYARLGPPPAGEEPAAAGTDARAA
jgi:MFS family permease